MLPLAQPVSFEEASIAKAEKRATKLAAFRAGNYRATARKKLRDPFKLRDTGRPELAFLWKNLLAMGRLVINRPPIITAAGETYTDPLPQALVLTAIVISFGMTALIVVIALRGFLETGSDRTDLNLPPAAPAAAGGAGGDDPTQGEPAGAAR